MHINKIKCYNESNRRITSCKCHIKKFNHIYLQVHFFFSLSIYKYTYIYFFYYNDDNKLATLFNFS